MSRYGCHPDEPDPRDYRVMRMAPRVAAALPPSIDYTLAMSKVTDQGSEGTCVAFASVDGLKEYEERLEANKVDLSPRYVYQHCKEIDGVPGEGTTIRAAMKVLQSRGVCPEECWPYHAERPGTPCHDADALAAPYVIDGYWRVGPNDVVQAMKESLVANGPFVAGIEVYESFEDARDGVVPMPAKSESWLGGHAICIVGYDDTKGYFKFKNSWGWDWGDGGYGYLPYSYMEPYLMDAWSARDRVGPAPDPTPKPWYVRLWEWILRLLGLA